MWTKFTTHISQYPYRDSIEVPPVYEGKLSTTRKQMKNGKNRYSLKLHTITQSIWRNLKKKHEKLNESR
jgi:hypothetical protein